MSELLRTFDAYGDFGRTPYFTFTFDLLPSKLLLEVPMNTSKVNMDSALRVLDLPDKNYELVYKDWNTEDWSNTDSDEDFPHKLFFKNRSKKSLVWVDLRNDTLFVEFLYDGNDAELEQQILQQNNALRKRFGLTKAPIFKVLTKNRSSFDTEEVRTEKVELDLRNNYNDGFGEVAERINKSISEKESGLILLYGKPGTGKTTYIKSLLSEHPDHNFIFIPNEFVNNLLDPAFISFLLKQRDAIIIIEDAEKVIASRENIQRDSVVSTLLQLTDGLFSDYLNIKVICTFNTSISKIDTALLRKGRMIAMFEFKPLCLEKANKLLRKIGAKQTDRALSISDIYNHEEEVYSNLNKRKIGFRKTG